jgi:hypothetical protein
MSAHGNVLPGNWKPWPFRDPNASSRRDLVDGIIEIRLTNYRRTRMLLAVVHITALRRRYSRQFRKSHWETRH